MARGRIGPSTAVSLAGLGSEPETQRSAEELAHDEARKAAVVEALRGVYDPELGLDIVTMGLVYDIRVLGTGVEVDMTLTTPGCPVSESLPVEAADAVQTAMPDAEVDLRIVWDPPWTPERLSPEAMEALGFTR